MESFVTLSEKAKTRIREYAAKNHDQNRFFRVFVESGGCSGFSYNFAFDKKQEGDLLVRSGDVDFLVDTASRDYLKGSVIDFVDDLKATGFTVVNPNAKGTCGCGVSFSV